MTIEIVTPSSRAHWLELRKSTVGASEVAALLGVHPWLTPYKLFMTKTGQYEESRQETKILENSVHLPPLERGNFMEERALELTRMLRPQWHVKANSILDENSGPDAGSMWIDRDTGLSSTPDASIDKSDFSGTGALQIKTVAPMEFGKHWKNENGDVQFPLYVAVQAIVDATLSGCEWACAGAMVSDFGVDFYLVDIPLIVGLMDRVHYEVNDFWRRVRENDPYTPDYGRDGDVIRSVYSDDDGGTTDLSCSLEVGLYERVLKLLAGREALQRCESAGTSAAKERREIDSELIHLLGNATRGTLADGRVIEAKTIRRAGYEVEPTTFRTIKIKQQRKSAA
jgi:hypothetical protein